MLNSKEDEVASITRRALLSATAIAALVGFTTPVTYAQTGTNAKPIRIIVPYKPGGPLDVSARAVAEAVRGDLGNVIIENKPGAGGNIGVSLLAKQKPDGMHMCIGAVATHAINPNLKSNLPYDPIKDFRPVTLICHVPNVLVITPDFQKKTGIKSVKDLVDYAKKNPGKLNYASGGPGSGGHMSGELLKTSAKIDMTHIPFKGAADAQLSVLAGQTDLIFDNLASAKANILAGKLIPLAVTTQKRSDELPNVPTMMEAGVKDFNISTWWGLFVPAKTPDKVLNRLNGSITKALKSTELKQRVAKLGGQVAPCSSADFTKFIKAELKKYETVIKAAGLRSE